MRVAAQDPNLIGTPGSAGFYNGASSFNAGDLNYRNGDLFAEYLKGSEELLVKFPDSWKFMARGEWLRDFKAADTAYSPLAPAAKDLVVNNKRLLDLWVSKDYNVGDQTGRIRLGNQVVSWGESLYMPGGINQTNSMDLERLTLPGVPLKEVFLPAPMLSWANGFGNGFNAEAYYQFTWNPNVLPPSGSYFSTGNALGAGATPLYYGNSTLGSAAGYSPISAGITPAQAAANGYAVPNPNGDGGITYGYPLLPNQNPKQSGQWGISGHYKPAGTDIDVGLYYLNYHEKNPWFQYVPDAKVQSGYDGRWAHPEDRHLVGVSTNFQTGAWTYGWELSYRDKDPVLVNPFGAASVPANQTLNTWVDGHRYQSHFTWWHQVSPSDDGGALVRWLGAQQSNVQGEVVGVFYPGVHNGLVGGQPINANFASTCSAGQYTPCTFPGSATSWGLVAYFDLTYDGTLIPGWQVNPNITISRGIKGNTPNMNFTWMQGVQSTALGVNFTMNPPRWVFSAQYVSYQGGTDYQQNLWKDRDWVGVTATLNF